MTRRRALLYALVVTGLWSTSFILNKIAFAEIGPLWLSFLRYEAAGLALAAIALPAVRQTVRAVGWRPVVVLGALGYCVAQGPFIWALSRVPVATLLLLAAFFGTVFVILIGVVALRERPRLPAATGLALTVVGVGIYAGIELEVFADLAAVAAIVVSSLAWAAWIVLGRHLVQVRVPAHALTAASMSAGALLLLPFAAVLEPLPAALSPGTLGIIVWLALVNTALAFTLWTASQRGLRAYESNVLANLVLLQASVLAVFVLNELLEPVQWVGLVVVLVGAVLAQWRRERPRPLLPEQEAEPEPARG